MPLCRNFQKTERSDDKCKLPIDQPYGLPVSNREKRP